ncbi:hypothetical protein [Labedaea rhizosphaerae]|uniref:Uncharacterized protein n=1 Tax=Labedaea rhizosphaerae TaxID=598644 RepID=A0A4R6SPM3_LABRH|nr:hypothetical protein [Labedaea rhizosphaerae]TDQ05442.1 hypothetical protein EV186_1011412 [Labedaea rhizosphaerae]
MLVDPGGGSVTPANIKASMDQFAQSAASGGFTVNETGGQALIAAIDKLLDWIDGSGTDLVYLAQSPKLGGSHGGKAISPFAQKVATDQQGFLTVLQQLQESLTTAKQGIKTAMKNYQETDATGRGKFIQA